MLRFTDFEALGLSVAAVSDRSDGDCSGDGARGAFGVACGVDSGAMVGVRQVHGSRIAAVGAQGGARWGVGEEPEADGLVTGAPGVSLAIRVADCVPVFLFDPRRRAVGLVHAGWRGTLAGVVGEGVRALVGGFGARVGALRALVGPSAGPCCYEVSPELAKEFRDKGLPVEGRMVDLWGAQANQLVSSGLPRSQVSICGICTICDGRFYSHRADGGPERNLALIGL